MRGPGGEREGRRREREGGRGGQEDLGGEGRGEVADTLACLASDLHSIYGLTQVSDGV